MIAQLQAVSQEFERCFDFSETQGSKYTEYQLKVSFFFMAW